MDTLDRLAFAAAFTLVWSGLLAAFYMAQRINPTRDSRFFVHVLIAAVTSAGVVLAYRM